MEDFNKDDLFFGMINKHAAEAEEQRNEEDRRNRIIEDNVKLIDRAMRASLRREEVQREADARKVEITKKRIVKICLMLVAMATVVILMLPAVKNASDTISDYKDTSTAICLRQEQAINNLSQYALINADGEPFNADEPNTSISYRRLDISSPEEVYVYKTILSDTEFNKLIGSLTYSGDDGEIQYYSSFDEYLKMNDFSSEEEFNMDMRENILESYGSDLAKSGGNTK